MSIVKEFEINGVIADHSEKELTEDEMTDLFVEWIESNGFMFGGKITDITQG